MKMISVVKNISEMYYSEGLVRHRKTD